MIEVNQALDPKLIERIRKTLALSRDGGATEHEAAVAADMAAKLMRKHNLTMAQIEAAGQSGGEGSKRTKQAQKGRAQYTFQQQLMQACAEVNFCAVLKQVSYKGMREMVSGFTLIGREANVIATQNMFDYLMTTTERLAFEYVGCDNTQRLSRTAVSFKEGCAERLAQRLQQRHAAAMAEQAREARERNAAAKHPSAVPGTALAVVLTDFAQQEKDRNEDFRLGWPEGTTAAKRKQWEQESRLEQAARAALKEHSSMDQSLLGQIAFKAAEQFAHTMGLNVNDEKVQETIHTAVQSAVRVHLDTLEEKAELEAETPKQKAAREERERKADQRFWKRYWREQREREQRRDPEAYNSGVRAGSKVGLDKQIDEDTTPDAKRLK